MHIRSRNRPSFPVVYTTRGTLLAAAFSGTCTVCGAVFSHSHFEPRPHGDDEKAEFFFDPTHSPYFQITGQSVFEVRLLEQVTADCSCWCNV